MRHNYVEAAIRTAPNIERDDQSLTLAAIGIAGEAIEAFEVTKQKIVNRQALVKELGDVCWYTALACFVADINFVELCAPNGVAIFLAQGMGGDRYEALDAHTGVLLVAAKNVSEFLKKQVFHNHPVDNDTLEMHLRALVRSVQVVAAWADFSIDEVLQMNIDKLKVRYPERFTTERSLNKNETME